MFLCGLTIEAPKRIMFVTQSEITLGSLHDAHQAELDKKLTLSKTEKILAEAQAAHEKALAEAKQASENKEKLRAQHFASVNTLYPISS